MEILSQKRVLIGSTVLTSVLFILEIFYKVTVNFANFYNTLIVVEVTLLGFFITAISLIILIFTTAQNQPNLINVVRKSKNYPRLYDYFINALYVYGGSILILLILWATNIPVKISYPIISFIIFITSGYVLIGIRTIKSIVQTFVTKPS